MSHTHFIAGDWGTSNLRLYLCSIEESGSALLLDTRMGPGIGELNDNYEAIFFDLARDWINRWGALPVILSGMVGSNIGWHEAPYLNCPVDAADIAAGGLQFTARGHQFSILAGLRTLNPLGLPDLMRGEELQMLGWIQQHQHNVGEPRLFALPGTHNKWAVADGDSVQTFITAFTGELFALLKNHSILLQDRNAVEFNLDAFMDGVHTIGKLGRAQLVHSLFAVRSRQVVGDLAPADGLSFLSGQIIAADVFGALELFPDLRQLTLIGESGLTERYRTVLQYLGCQVDCCDPEQIAVSGYASIYRALQTNT